MAKGLAQIGTITKIIREKYPHEKLVNDPTQLGHILYIEQEMGSGRLVNPELHLGCCIEIAVAKGAITRKEVDEIIAGTDIRQQSKEANSLMSAIVSGRFKSASFSPDRGLLVSIFGDALMQVRDYHVIIECLYAIMYLLAQTASDRPQASTMKQ
jgi:hypothetical protein